MLEKSNEELLLAKNNYSQFEEEKRRELKELDTHVQRLQAKLHGLSCLDKKEALNVSSIVQEFKEFTNPNPQFTCPSDHQWNQLSKAFKQTSPLFYEKISSSSLSVQEYRATLLTILGFSTGDMALLIGTTPQRISNARRNANKKLFGKDDSPSFTEGIERLWKSEDL